MYNRATAKFADFGKGDGATLKGLSSAKRVGPAQRTGIEPAYSRCRDAYPGRTRQPNHSVSPLHLSTRTDGVSTSVQYPAPYWQARYCATRVHMSSSRGSLLAYVKFRKKLRELRQVVALGDQLPVGVVVWRQGSACGLFCEVRHFLAIARKPVSHS